jgi:hypothetical protein
MTAPLSVSASSAAVQETGSETETVQAIFFVTADADPGMAPRLIEPLAKLGLVPWRVHISSEDGAGENISADLRVRDVSRKTAHAIDKALRCVIGVRQVISLVE